jgi:hypothetical protein
MLGANRKIIVSITHFLVVERFYFILYNVLYNNAKVNIASS